MLKMSKDSDNSGFQEDHCTENSAVDNDHKSALNSTLNSAKLEAIPSEEKLPDAEEGMELQEIKIKAAEDKNNTTTPNDRSAARVHPFKLYVLLPFDIVAKNFEQYKREIKITIGILLLLLYCAYFIAALSIDSKRAENLLIVTVIAVVCFVYWVIKKFTLWEFCDSCWMKCTPLLEFCKLHKRSIVWVFSIVVVILLIIFIAVDTANNPRRLISLGGLFLYLFICFLFSRDKWKIQWRPVLSGLLLQFILGLLVMRTTPGYLVFKWIGDRFTIFLTFSDAGAKLLFGDPQYLQHIVAFKMFPTVVFTGAILYVFYYLEIMEVLVKKFGWLLNVLMGTSAAESLSTAGNVFVGMVEAPLLVRPFLADMTNSELFAVMTGGMATIAGSVFGLYITFGAPPAHLLSASVMSAPAALAVAKLMVPEIGNPKTRKVDEIVIEKCPEKTVMEAFVNGASMTIAIVANIAVSIIVILGIKEFVNVLLTWLGIMVGIKALTLELILSYIFMPFAFMMGVDWKDARIVGQLLGTKTVVNEFIAYQQFGKYVSSKSNVNTTTMSIRSEVITTYALCGFSNFQGLGIMMGGLAALIPSRRSDISKLALWSLLSGTIACFTTACIAGLLYKDI